MTFLLLSWIAAQPTIGQDLAGATPTTRVFPVFFDSRIEEPPVYSGVAADDSVRLQVLTPDAAALEAYGLTGLLRKRGQHLLDPF